MSEQGTLHVPVIICAEYRNESASLAQLCGYPPKRRQTSKNPVWFRPTSAPRINERFHNFYTDGLPFDLVGHLRALNASLVESRVSAKGMSLITRGLRLPASSALKRTR